MINKHKHLIRCKYKLYKIIIKEYDEKYIKLKYILNNHKYNKKNNKLKKHFPVNFYNTFDDYNNIYNKQNNCNVSFSMLLGDIELQKSIILDTLDRRYNGIKIFGNNLNESMLKNYILRLCNIEIFDISHLKDDIIYYNTPKSITQQFPNFINKNNNTCMFDYVFSIRSENMHHYVDLKNNKLCDRILICGKDEIYNIMFESSNLNICNNIKTDKIKDFVLDNFNNKSFKI